ncbi:MAG: hypothetical protein R3323_08970 [Wenzhouxiangellaceae bacterium]|nr:hypothetical protein [Wenzhouxiangellaceae bacterium]
MRSILPAPLAALACAALLTALLGGCGLKGDLVLPEDSRDGAATDASSPDDDDTGADERTGA